MKVSTQPGASVGGANAPDPHLVGLRDLIYQVAGIFHPDNKLRLLEDRCRRRMQALKVRNLREYYECLTVRPIRQTELTSLLNEITIGETCFFRNQPQLTAIRNIVLPKIVAARGHLSLRQLRIWSAGCSTGEEPYTIAMLVLDERTERLRNWTVEILATDINERSLLHAREGVYSPYSTRHVTAYYRDKYFTPVGENLLVNREVQALVKFRRLNLLDDARMAFMKDVDIILCCNVLIYFDLQSKRRVIQHFYNNLLAHGHLFLGHSESMYGVNDDFRLVHLPSATAYMKLEQRKIPGRSL